MPALGTSGTATYRARLSHIEAALGPRPAAEDLWTSRHSHEWFVIEWNARRLAALDRELDAIIRTDARDRKVAAWLEDTAEAFEEIGEIDLALNWAKCRSLSYQRTATFNYYDLYSGRQSIRPAMSSLSRSWFPQRSGWVRRHPPGHHDAGLRRQPGTHLERVSKPAPSRRTDPRQTTPMPHNSAFSRPHLPTVLGRVLRFNDAWFPQLPPGGCTAHRRGVPHFGW